MSRISQPSLRFALAAFLVPLCGTTFVAAQNRERGYPPQIDGAAAMVYKKVGETELQLWLFQPEGHKSSDRRPAVVFFFGGGWTSGTPAQFVPHCRHLAKRGMIACVADYRVASRHGVKAVDCVRDAKSVVRWLRGKSAELGIDPERIAAGGGSAGGHIAACTGVVAGFEETGESPEISSAPNLLVLFNPALVLAPVEEDAPSPRAPRRDLGERLGVENPASLSPYHAVRKGAPATLIFHGKADTTVPYRTAELFAEVMKKAGNECELIGYDGAAHGFFNHGRGDNEAYHDTLQRMDRFFARHGYLEQAERQ